MKSIREVYIKYLVEARTDVGEIIVCSRGVGEVCNFSNDAGEVYSFSGDADEVIVVAELCVNYVHSCSSDFFRLR